MPHGGPDWGTVGPIGTIFTIEDLGELAARLGSPDTFDRRGNVIFIDNFDSGIEPWWIGGNPAGWAGRWCPDQHRSGGFSLELTTKAEAGASAYAERYFPYPSKSRLGVEMHFNHNFRVKEAEFLIEVYDGENLYEVYIQLVGDTWQYWGADHAYHDLDPTTDLMPDLMFHTFKLVFDLTTGEFAHLIIDTTVFDLAKYKMYSIGSDSAPAIYIHYEITADVFAQAAQAWIDDLILTQNEP